MEDIGLAFLLAHLSLRLMGKLIGRLCRPSVVYTLRISSSQKLLDRWKPNFMWLLNGMRERKFVQMIQVIWPRWSPCPYMVKTRQKSSPKPADRLPSNLVYTISDSDPSNFVQMMILVDLDLLTAMSNFLPNAFVWENAKILDLTENIDVHELKVATSSWLSQYINTCEYQRSRSLFHLCPKSLDLYF